MNARKHSYMPDLAGKRSDILDEYAENMPDHALSGVNIGVSNIALESKALPMVGQRSGTPSELLTVLQAAELLACDVKTVRRHCAAGKYPDAKKQLGNGGEGWLIPVSNLSKAAQKAYAKKRAAELVEESGVKDVALSAPMTTDAEYAQLWDRFERKDGNFKRMANEAYDILIAYLALRETGVSVGFAEEAIKTSHGAARSTIRRYLGFTKNHPRQHWLPLLCPQYHGGRARADFTPAAYDFILALKIKSPAAKLRVLIRAAVEEGANKGWVLPSEDTIAKRLKEEPAWLYQGNAALERSFPTIERDYSSLALHQCWESDGRRADVWCRWPDGTVNRPFVIAIREVRTRRPLSIRICHNPDTEAVLGAYGAALTNSQAVPSYFKLDNGREYANKPFTGGQKNRYRFKPKVEEAKGILTAMDVQVKWSQPGQGRDKPIESWWNVIAENCDKSPAFVGAYCGKDVLSKPEDFDKKKAVPVEAYGARLIKEIKAYERRPHRGHGMAGRTPLEVYDDLAATTVTRKPDASEIRRCKMGVHSLSLDKRDCTFSFKMKGYPIAQRYWHEALANLSATEREGKFNVHFDWDEPNSPVAVYRGDTFICDAAPLGRIDFIEERGGGKVQAHMSAKGNFLAQRKKTINAAKQGGSVALLTSDDALTLPPMVAANPELVIVPSSRVRAVATPVSPIEPIPGKPGEFVDQETGEIFIGAVALREKTKAATSLLAEDVEAELEAMKRKQQAMREEVQRKKQAALEEAEKNLPARIWR